jgi:hypothetical protein
LASTAWLVRFRPRLARANARARWLTPEGAFSSDSTKALVVSTPQAAAERLQAFVELKGWPLRAVERFALVAADHVYVCDKQKDPEPPLPGKLTPLHPGHIFHQGA